MVNILAVGKCYAGSINEPQLVFMGYSICDHVAGWNKTSVVWIHQKKRVNVIYLKFEVKNMFYRAMLKPVHEAKDENTLSLHLNWFKYVSMHILQSTKYLRS